jgi:hypothetical protein
VKFCRSTVFPGETRGAGTSIARRSSFVESHEPAARAGAPRAPVTNLVNPPPGPPPLPPAGPMKGRQRGGGAGGGEGGLALGEESGLRLGARQSRSTSGAFRTGSIRGQSESPAQPSVSSREGHGGSLVARSVKAFSVQVGVPVGLGWVFRNVVVDVCRGQSGLECASISRARGYARAWKSTRR